MDLYISTDIETDGPTPGINSMLSLGSVLLDDDGAVRATFTANLETLPEARPDPRTMAWWATQPDAWAACRTGLETPQAAMARYAAWLDGLGDPRDRRVFVAWPVGFDFTFVYWYLMRFAGRCPFGHSGLDMRSYAMGLLGSEYGGAGKSRLPAAWRPSDPHTHVALEDALEQGRLFMNMRRAGRAGGRRSPD